MLSVAVIPSATGLKCVGTAWRDFGWMNLNLLMVFLSADITFQSVDWVVIPFALGRSSSPPDPRRGPDGRSRSRPETAAFPFWEAH
jgi:hypothetical protein